MMTQYASFNDLPPNLVNMVYNRVDELYLQEHKKLFENRIKHSLIREIAIYWDMEGSVQHLNEEDNKETEFIEEMTNLANMYMYEYHANMDNIVVKNEVNLYSPTRIQFRDSENPLECEFQCLYN